MTHISSATDGLQSCHNEVMFYQHVGPLIASVPGLHVPALLHVDERDYHAFQPTDAPDTPAHPLRQSEYMFVMERVSDATHTQHSPLSRTEAYQSLELLARLHAWGWQDEAKLGLVGNVLHKRATYWELSRRGGDGGQMKQMPEVMAEFICAFEAVDLNGTLQQPGVAQIGERMVRICPWLSEEINSHHASKHQTIVHGEVPPALGLP